MKNFFALTIAMMIIFQSIGLAATGTFSASGEYLMSDYDTPEIAEKITLDFAKQSAAEQAGIYLENYSRSSNFKLEVDEIKTVASSKVEVLEKNITRKPQPNNRILLHADIKASVDTSDLDNFLKQEHEKRQQAIQRYKNLQEMHAKLKEDIEIFQAKLSTIKDDAKDEDLIVEQERINREFLAIKKSEEFSNELTASKDFSFNINHLKEAIALQPKLPWLYIEYGVFKTLGGNVDNIKAKILADPNNASNVISSTAPDIKEIKKAIILAPDKGSSYGMLAVHYSTLGSAKKLANENDEAEKYFNKALENHNMVVKLDSQNAWSHINRGGFFFTYLKDYEKALKDYETATKLNPNKAYVYEHKGELYKELKKYPEAIKNYKKALQVDPENFSDFDYIKLGDIYKELKKYSEAIEIYTQAIEKLPKFAHSDHRVFAYNDRAEIYIKLGEYDKAVADCDKGLELTSDSISVWLLEKTKRHALEEKEQHG